MKMTKERMKKTNAEIQTIPERIDEATRAMPIISEDAEQLKAKLESYNSEIDELTLEMNSIILSNDDENKKNEMIRNIQMQIKEARIDYQNEFSNKRGEFQNQINVISSEINKLNMKFNSIESRISNTEKDIKYESRNADNLRKQFYDYQTEYKEILGNEWDTSKEICPTCGQSLPDNEIEVLKAKFNLDKSNKLEDIKAKIADITQRGITINEGIEQEQALINSLKKEQEKIGTDLVLKKQELNKLEKSKPQIEPFETTETYKIFQSKLKEANELSVQNINDERMDEIEIELKELKTKAEEAQYILNQLSTVEYQKKRITELKETQKALSATYEKMESHIYLCEQFIKAKVNMITENINQKFESVSFKLFETQINGGLKECCEVMIPSPGGVSVTYASANNAAKINAGLEIVETLQRHFNMELPVFIDNAESVTKLRNTATQVIRLVVDENYKELKSMEE
jgi:chromosome segregation ATPase